MKKMKYEEPIIDVLVSDMKTDVITWSNGDPDNVQSDSWDDF